MDVLTLNCIQLVIKFTHKGDIKLMKTIADIDPRNIFTTKQQFKFIKRAKSNIPFTINDDKIAQHLIILNLIKKEEIRIPRSERDINDFDDYGLCPPTKITGKYILTPEGEHHIDYKKSQSQKSFWTETRSWITLIIAVFALLLSVYSIYLDYYLVK